MTKHMQDNDIVIPAPYPSEEDLFLFVDQNKIETLYLLPHVFRMLQRQK